MTVTPTEQDALVARLVNLVPANAAKLALVRILPDGNFDLIVEADTAPEETTEDAYEATAGLVAFFAGNYWLNPGNEGVLVIADRDGNALLNLPLEGAGVDSIAHAFDTFAEEVDGAFDVTDTTVPAAA